jgi:hypothetical protein
MLPLDAAVADAGNLADASGGEDAALAVDASATCTADTENDPANCGSCGHVCELFAAFARCVSGTCAVDHCAPGYWNVDARDDDGCEYACVLTRSGVEACDGIDNDCDGAIDNGFDLSRDPQNCGACGKSCDLPNAIAGCGVVDGASACVISACADGFADLDQRVEDGCEYSCPVWPPGVEACNAVDDDCDGFIDEGNPGGGLACESSCPGGFCQGECTPGTTSCSGAVLVCVPGQGPTLEICDGKDNDCDGQVDEGFDVLDDPLNCGSCGNVCVLADAIAACSNGHCSILACQPGNADLDGDLANGCEYRCPVYPPRMESCNGLDDDCNGVVDDPQVLAAQKPPAAGCQPKPGTPCAGADQVCQGASGWRCSYGPGVEVDSNGALALTEARCDGIDGNCNGQVDEAFPELGTACDNGLLGACRDAGRQVCDPADPNRTLCDLSFPPDPVPGAPSAEICNGVDDDCDGLVDNGVVDDLVHITAGGLNVYLDRYEASRPGATATSAGTNEARRCVLAGVLPWTNASQAEAAAACARTGARLCTAAELQAVCESGAADAYPYGMSYEPSTCNGLDFDGVAGGADDNLLLPTGATALAACVTPAGVHDLSGNAAEWTSTVTGNTGAPQNLAIYMAKGGSYLTPALGLTCQFTLSRYASTTTLPELGFRCCHD